MIHLRRTENLAKWYDKTEDNRPTCASCDLYIVRYEDTLEVVHEEGGIEILCRTCSGRVKSRQYISLEDLRKETGGEERCREIEEALAIQRAARAKEFRQERARKAARTKAEKSKARSGLGVENGDGESRGQPRIRQPKKVGNPKVRRPR